MLIVSGWDDLTDPSAQECDVGSLWSTLVSTLGTLLLVVACVVARNTRHTDMLATSTSARAQVTLVISDHIVPNIERERGNNHQLFSCRIPPSCF